MKPKLYGELASWWPLVSAPADYVVEASRYAQLLRELCSPTRVLELGSGGGNTASHLKAWFDMTLVDLSPEMLAVSRALNPECEHRQGDMRAVRLAMRFDAVFIHDAVSYMTSLDDLARALETARVHCRPGGAALVVPDHFRDTYRPGISTGGNDARDRCARYLQWSYDPDPDDTTVETDYAFLLRAGSGPTRIAHDHHTLGLFDRGQWLDLCRRAGFDPEIRAVETGDPEVPEIEAILCRAPAR